MAATNTLDLTLLPDYINEHKDELFVKSTLGAKTLDYVEIMPNVKYKDALNFLDSEVVLQDGSKCGWNPQGSDVFSQRFIETKAVEVEKEYCWKDFEKKYMNYQLLWEAGREKLPFEEKIAQSNMNAIQEAVEYLVWNGEEDLGIGGFINNIAGENDAIKVVFESGATVSAKVDAMVAALTIGMLKKGVNIYMSYTDFRNYIQEQNGTCCANKPVIDAASESIKYFGDSRITLIPVLGLEDAGGAMVASTPDGLVYATDVEGSDRAYRMWFDEKEEKFMFRVLFRAGTAVKMVDEVVLGRGM
jgi:hypothetical protein